MIIYEAVFLNNEAVAEAFKMVRQNEKNDLPLKPESYHVTTAYKPERPRTELYGTPVKVEVVSYKRDDTLLDCHGHQISNYGFSVKITSDNPAMQEELDRLSGRNWHITGGFLHKGNAVYTNDIIFSKKCIPCSFVFDGVFGGWHQDIRS